jgi:hypothetical protein
MVTVINFKLTTAYLSYIIKAVAAEYVVEYGGLLPKIPFSRHNYSELHSSGSKKWPMSPKSADFSFG